MENTSLHSDMPVGISEQLPPSYPFVKWAGGKTQISNELIKHTPAQFYRYFEPFIGGGAFFFYLLSKRKIIAIISDLNKELINTYNIIKYYPEELIAILNKHEYEYKKSPTDYYYRLRATIPLENIEKAGRFIALNKTCYNGLYRVNKNGQFNVPIGRYKNPLICDSKNIRNVSLGLRYSNTQIHVSDYKKVLLDNAKEMDFIYLDPPYDPLNDTAKFTSYTNSGFSTNDQKELAEIFKILDKRNCKVLLSNSNTQLIRNLYSDYSNFIVEVKASRAINSKSNKRSGHSELLIRNYE